MHKQSSLNHRRDEEGQSPSNSDPYFPKPQKPKSIARPVNYLLKEQRLLFVLVGMLIATTIFMLQPNLARHGISNYVVPTSEKFVFNRNKNAVDNSGTKTITASKVLMGLRRQPLRIVVTGGAGFVGSHLVDRLMERGDNVIVIDNFFTGRKENIMHHFNNPRFELIRHDVIEPILLEVDQIYHLACPASPVHYKYNPVKTIISTLCCQL